MDATHQERGQALVLIVLVLICLMGFVALAVDSAMLYTDRRRAQSAADSAALAAAMARHNGKNAALTALNFAKMNGFDDANPDVDVLVTETKSDGYTFFKVTIRNSFAPFFSQFVYSGSLENTVEATSRYKNGAGSPAIGNALVATSPNACQAMCVGGSTTLNIFKGGMFSNSNREGNGDTANPCHSLALHGNVRVHVTGGGSIESVGTTYKFGSSGSVNVEPPGKINQKTHSPMDLPSIPDLDCSKLTKRLVPKVTGGDPVHTLQPGYYPNGINIQVGPAKITFADGIYCIDKGLTMIGTQFTGANVFLYVKSGGVLIEGHGAVDLRSGSNIPGDTGKLYSGKLIYIHKDNDSRLRIAGSSNSKLEGMIFAPKMRPFELAANPCGSEGAPYKCEIVGTSGVFTANSQIMCDTVHVKGSAAFTLSYSGTNAAQSEATIDLYK